MEKLILFGTQACHLCDEAEQLLAKKMPEFAEDFQLEYIDIVEQEQWQEKYAVRIPVLYHPATGAELGWPFGQIDVQQFLIGLNNQ